MKYYIIAGEASGDLHGSNLIKELKKLDGAADFRMWGGDLMQQAGGALVKHYKSIAFMGFFEVFMNIRTILKNLVFCKQDIIAYQPDALILIDYPGFNLRIAEFAYKKGLKVLYYISPKVWAWKESRVEKLQQFVHRLYVIFPFEKEYFAKHNMQAEYVGNPLIDAIEQKKQGLPDAPSFIRQHQLPDKPVIALLAGSRKQEVARILPEMLKVVPHFPGYQFIIAGAPSLGEDFYHPLIEGKEVQILFNQTYEILHIAQAALVTSGTATLETALFQVPQAVCYKASGISYVIAKAFIKIRYISLVNIIMDKQVVKELIQRRCNEEMLTNELKSLLGKDAYRQSILDDYQLLKEYMGKSGSSARLARSIINDLNS